MLLQEEEGFGTEIGNRVDAQRLHAPGGYRADAVEARYGQCLHQPGPISGVTTNCLCRPKP
jgi:hypothetical protein